MQGSRRGLVGVVAVALLALILTNPTANVYAATLSPAVVVQGSDAPVTISGSTNVPIVVFVQVSRCKMSIVYSNQIGPVVGSYSVSIPTSGLEPGTYSVLVNELGASAVSILSFVVIPAG